MNAVSAPSTTSPTCRSCSSGERSTCRSRRRSSEFLLDAATGNLPSVSFVDPRFVGEAERRLGRAIIRVARHPHRRRLSGRSVPGGRRGSGLGQRPSSSSPMTSGAASSTTWHRPRCRAERRRPGPRKRQGAPRPAHPGRRGVAVHSREPGEPARRLDGLRQHVDPEAHRVALEPEAADARATPRTTSAISLSRSTSRTPTRACRRCRRHRRRRSNRARRASRFRPSSRSKTCSRSCRDRALALVRDRARASAEQFAVTPAAQHVDLEVVHRARALRPEALLAREAECWLVKAAPARA